MSFSRNEEKREITESVAVDAELTVMAISDKLGKNIR